MLQRKIKILGSGKFLPSKRLSAEDTDEWLNLKPGTALKTSGVAERFHMADDETLAQMGARAVERALIDANLDFCEIDALIFASTSLEQYLPCSAAFIQNELGQGDSGIPCFDINATCLSFLAAFDQMSYSIAGGQYKKVVIVSSEAPSSVLNPEHMESATLFGDGAVAFVLGASDKEDDTTIIRSRMATYSRGIELCHIKGGGMRLRPMAYTKERHAEYCFMMQGPKLFKETIKCIPGMWSELMEGLPYTMEDISVVVPHQASKVAIKLVSRRMGIADDKLVNILSTHGNQVAASLPMALHEGFKTKKIQKGQLVLLIGMGAGFALSMHLLRI